jgi:hypothetical protein
MVNAVVLSVMAPFLKLMYFFYFKSHIHEKSKYFSTLPDAQTKNEQIFYWRNNNIWKRKYSYEP